MDGKEVTALNAQELRQTRRKIGMIFLHFNLMPSRTVAGNVAYPLRGSGLSKKEAADKVTHLLELVGSDIKVVKINVDEEQELAMQFGVMSIPTLVVMKNGKIVNQVTGARPKAQILAML